MTDYQMKWDKIARAYYKQVAGHNDVPFFYKDGLCSAVHYLFETCIYKCFRRFVEKCGTMENGYWVPLYYHCGYKQEHNLLRGDFATLMSCLTDQEFLELLSKP